MDSYFDVSDEEDDTVINPLTSPVPVSQEERHSGFSAREDDSDLDEVDEDTSMRMARNVQQKEPPASDAEEEEEGEETEDDGVISSISVRGSAVAAVAAEETPSALREEKEARELADKFEDRQSEAATEHDPDLVVDEAEYNLMRPIIRDQGKAKPCYRAPFAACVHMPLKTETGAIEPLEMTVDTFCEIGSKNRGTTKDIIKEITPYKLAQQVIIFNVYGGKGGAVNSLRNYAAFIRVQLTDLAEDSSLGEMLAGGLGLYQLHPTEFAITFAGDHATKLPKSLVPVPKTVQYVKLSPKLELEANPGGWILCPSVCVDKPQKRRGARTEKPEKKQKNGEEPQFQVVTKEAAAASIDYKDYTRVESTATLETDERSHSKDDVSPSQVETKTQNSSECHMEWRMETYSFDLESRESWPSVGPSFDFDPQYSTLEVSFKVHKK